MTALKGLRVVELEAKGPAPYAVMLMADLGADVIRIDRVRANAGRLPMPEALQRGRRSVALNLKDPAGLRVLHRLLDTADVLVESYRPGVAERLGFGPDACRERNPRLIYARMTGWGQDGPLAGRAGHDINFLSLAGALHPMGSADRPPPPPLNLLGDYGGGAMFLIVGVLASLLERERSGQGQIIDAAMVDGVASMLTAFHAMRAAGAWTEAREDNVVDGGAPWYRSYKTADGGYIAVGALEPAFYEVLLERLGLDGWPMHERDRWPAQRAELARIFAQHPRSHWERQFDGTDACVTPVLTLEESTRAPQLVARAVLQPFADTFVPAPAPRLSRTPATVAEPCSSVGAATDEVLAGLGISPGERARLRDSGAIG
ncbi:MAG TPA: CaiB/BaiF CoA-transferase family protein [Solirubrobacteraceae bacterium]|nr:CaiB/BaiF CoA-transferase family protein [Solirubrobacteraceae bacterium]